MLKTVLPGQVSMKANTALGFLASGVAAWLLREGRPDKRRFAWGRALGAGVALLGLLTLLEYATGLDFRIDQFLFREVSGLQGTSHPGRMAPNTALAFLCAGTALAVLGLRERLTRYSSWLGAATIMFGVCAFTGHLFGVQAMTGFGRYTLMAVHTSVGMIILGLGIVFARPGCGWVALLCTEGAAGFLVRTLVPGFAVLMTALGWVKLHGERDHWYDSAYGGTLFTVVRILLLTVVTFVVARAVRRIEAVRDAATEDLRVLNAELEKKVAARTAEMTSSNESLGKEVVIRRETESELREALRKIEDNNRAKSEFVFNVSHELRTPLASLRYSADNLLSGVAGPVEGRVRDYVEMMREDCERLIGTVNDILDMSRIEMNRLRLNMATVPFGWFIGRSLAPLRKHAAVRGLKLDYVEKMNAFVRCDPGKIERVLTNLAGNAIKFTPPGGNVLVELVRSDARGARGEALLRVTDTGVGIAPEHLPHITKRYYRACEEVSGTGLGLSLCREMLEAHGGRIIVVSPVPGTNGGTQVTAVLPVAEPPLVMIAEDDTECRHLLELQVTRMGYRAIGCGSGDEALEAMEGNRPDIIVMDIFMPGMDGVQAIARVKCDSRWRSIPVIAITGGNLSLAKREVLEGFGIPILGKPWKADELLAMLHEAGWGHAYVAGASQDGARQGSKGGS